jgi:hypothetical protein
MDGKCKDRITACKRSRLDDLALLWDRYGDPAAGPDEDLGSMDDYGISIEYAEGSREGGYIRYILSCGGPHEEIRFYISPSFGCYRIEFLLADWNDSAVEPIEPGPDHDLLQEIYESFIGRDIVKHFIDKYQRENR